MVVFLDTYLSHFFQLETNCNDFYAEIDFFFTVTECGKSFIVLEYICVNFLCFSNTLSCFFFENSKNKSFETFSVVFEIFVSLIRIRVTY